MDPDVVSAIGSISSASIAVLALVIAFFAWRTAAHSAEATKALTRIERTRLHGELRPQFDVESRRDPNGDVHVIVTLVGPPMLDRLDSLHATIRPFTLPGSRPGVDEGLASHVFSKAWHGGDGHPMSTKPQVLMQGELVVYAVAGRDGYVPKLVPIRMNLICRYKDYDPWIVPLTMHVKDSEPKREAP